MITRLLYYVSRSQLQGESKKQSWKWERKKLKTEKAEKKNKRLLQSNTFFLTANIRSTSKELRYRTINFKEGKENKGGGEPGEGLRVLLPPLFPFFFQERQCN